jgi:hypothetical protein
VITYNKYMIDILDLIFGTIAGFIINFLEFILIPETVALYFVFLGGFVFLIISAILMSLISSGCSPGKKISNLLISLIPTFVFVGMSFGDMFVHGRDIKYVWPLIFLIIPFIFYIYAYKVCYIKRIKVLMFFNIVFLIWAFLALLNMTNYCFMGACA